jgi:hypothetical protein
VEAPATCAIDPLGVQPQVDRVRARLVVQLPPERGEPHVVLPATLGARTVARGERGRLVEEEQLREAAGAHQRMAAAVLELEAARDPAAHLVAPHDPTRGVVQAPAIAVHEPTGRIGEEVSERGDAVLQRHASGPNRTVRVRVRRGASA